MAAPFHKVVGPVPMTVAASGAAQAALALPPLLAQIQAMLFGAFGLGPLRADLLAQFNASASFALTYTDPLAALKQALAATLQVTASLQAAIAAGIPPLGIGVQVSANLALAAALQAKIGGINALIDLALQVRLEGLGLLAELEAALALGGVTVYAWEGQDMQTAQAQIAAHGFQGDGFSPGQNTYGMMLVTAAPGASSSFRFLFCPQLP